ncbi:hypothetical protein [Agrobacterium pusense]|uniref:hypothetical protein n=1 Tax=Agrobacterium pusense TaxID=648995 RepID=UPI00384BDEFC
MNPEPTNIETEVMQYLVAALGGHSVTIVRHEPVGVEKLLGFSVGKNRSFAIRDLLDRVTALTVKPHWEVEEFKIWKGIDEEKPCWSGLNIVTDDWHEANSYVEYLSGNKPEGVFRVAFAKFQPIGVTRPAPSVAVKALEWELRAYNSGNHNQYISHSIVGTYAITDLRTLGWFEWLNRSGGPVGRVETLEEAKAAAQADYEARIRSALSAQMQTPAIDDGRPCAMDVFAAALQDDCDDPFDRWEAIVEWLHGDWDAALSYLEDETRARIAPAKQEGGK